MRIKKKEKVNKKVQFIETKYYNFVQETTIECLIVDYSVKYIRYMQDENKLNNM